MSAEKIEAVIDCQADLIEAIHLQDASAIVRASEALACAVADLRDCHSWPSDPAVAERLRSAMRANQAATMQIDLMAHWTRQKIDRLSVLRRNRNNENGYKHL